MKQVFVALQGRARSRWTEAFPGAEVVADVAGAAIQARSGPQIVWLDCSGLDSTERSARLRAAIDLGCRTILMTPTPSEAEAFQALKEGVVGYCHTESAPEQLREIALVVEHGGLWMPPELIQRLMALSLRVMPPPPSRVPALNTLTPRELMVAERVAHGATNREIADALDITERTVKAHLSVIFDKLDVRDRVQLALAMNNISTYATVN